LVWLIEVFQRLFICYFGEVLSNFFLENDFIRETLEEGIHFYIKEVKLKKITSLTP
jgi:hypothetical protein